MLSRRLVAMALLSLLAVVVFLVGRILQAKGMAWAGAFGSIGAFVLALIAFLAPVFARWLRGPTWTSAAAVGQAAEDLAKALSQQLAAEERLRRINDPHPLPVSWDVTPTAMAAMVGVLDELENDDNALQVLATLGGNFNDIRSAFERVPSRRLVMLGSAGAGKSVLVTKLARELLAQWTEGQPVPVIVSAATWNPAMDLPGWVADQLARTHPALASEVKTATGKVVSIAAELANGGVLPILDGLDELPEELRAEAITAINSWGSDMPIVVTSRPAEYLAAVETAGRAISRAMAIEVLPLRVPQVKAYLGHATAAVPSGRWRDVFDAMDADPHGPLAAALTTPLMVWLARTIYEAADSDPSELARGELAANREAIENHLLDAFVPSVYANRKNKTLLHWAPRQAQGWLAFLAGYLKKTNSQDLASWRLSNAARAWRPVGFAVRGTLLFATAWGLAFWVIRRHREWRSDTHPLLAKLSSLLLSGSLGRHIFPTVNYVLSGNFPGVGDVTRPVEHILTTWPRWHSLLSLEIWVALIAIVGGIFSALDDSYGYNIRPRPRTVKIRVSRVLLKALRAAWRGVFIMLAIILAVSFLYVLAKPHHTSPHLTWHIVMMFCQVHSIWLLLMFGALWGLTRVPESFAATIDISREVSPAKVLRIDRQATILIQLLKKSSRTALAWLYFGSDIGIAYALYSATSLLCRLFLGGRESASDRFADARIWLACSRRMPVRAMTFLGDAHSRGVLRQVGPVYQFRHIRLQQRLSERYTDWLLQAECAFMYVVDRHKARAGITWWPKFISPPFEPVWAQRFQETAALMSAQVEIGNSVEKIHAEGRGLAQAFEGGDDRWVLCAIPRQQPVLVAGSVWQALMETGRGARYLESVGIPTMSKGIPAQQRIIRADARKVKVAAGSWGPGWLVYNQQNGSWHWEPEVRYESPSTLLSAGPEINGLRLLAEARIHWAEPFRKIEPEMRQELADRLTESDLTYAIADLAARRKMLLSPIRWTDSKGETPTGSVSVLGITAGWPSLRAEASIWPPPWQRGLLISSAEVRIENSGTWRDTIHHVGASGSDVSQLQLSLDELLKILAVLWQAVTEVLPAVVIEDPESTVLARPPVVNIRLETRKTEKAKDVDLRELIDFSPWHTNRRLGLTVMSVEITSPLRLSGEERRVNIRQAFMYMTQRLGFRSSNGDWLQEDRARV